LFRQAGPEQSRFETYQVHAGFDTIADQLRRAGHGAFAAVVTGWQDGESHAWAAVNHQGEVRWLDAQLDVIENDPVPARWVRTLEAVLVDGDGLPVPFSGLPQSPWSTREPSPEYAAAIAGPAPAGFLPVTGRRAGADAEDTPGDAAAEEESS
jgi:hypothetical protein